MFEIDPARVAGGKVRQGLSGIWLGQASEHGPALRPLSPAGRGPRVENHAAAHRPLRRLVPEDKAVAVEGADRPFEYDLGERLSTRRQALAIEKGEPRWHSGRADMQVYRRRFAHRSRFGRQQPDAGIEVVGGPVQGLIEHPVAAADPVLVELQADEIERATLSRL